VQAVDDVQLGELLTSISLASRTASSTRMVYASFSPGLRWKEQYAQLAEQTFVR